MSQFINESALYIITGFVTSVQVKLRDLDAINADGSKGREWTVKFDDVVAEVQQVRLWKFELVISFA